MSFDNSDARIEYEITINRGRILLGCEIQE